MSELISNLNTIESCKLDIKSAIEAKGVSMSGVSFPDYPSAIGSITTSFVTTTLSTSVNGTFTPGVGIDGYSQVVVDVPQSVTGFTTRNFIEGSIYSSIVYDPSASKVAERMFDGRSIVTTVSLPQCTSIYYRAFAGCTNISEISLPMCKFVGQEAFVDCHCSNITTLYLPSCSYIDMSAFRDLNYVTTINLPICEGINNAAFLNCSSLSVVILGSSRKVTGGYYVGNFPTKSTASFSILVPASLVDTYKADQECWGRFYESRIFPIPE